MNTSLFSRSFVLLLIMVCTFSVNGQDVKTKEAVILYNSVPYMVELAKDGKIVEFIKEMPNYMGEYEMVIRDYAFASDEPIDIFTPTENTTIIEGATTVSTERVFVDFSEGYATLDDEDIKTLDEMVDYLNQKQYKNLLITMYQNGESRNAEKLAVNRLDSVKSYLKLKGISEDRLVISKVITTNFVNNISFNYIDK